MEEGKPSSRPRQDEEGRSQQELFKECRGLKREARFERMGELLREGLRRRALDAEGILHAGRLLRELPATSAPDSPLEVLILGQCTTAWLVDSLTAVAAGRGETLHVREGGYDNVFQDIATLERAPDVIVLLPWNQRLWVEGGGDDGEQRLAEELEFWGRAQASVVDRSRLLQVGYDWVSPGAMGHHLAASRDGAIGLVRRANMALRERLPAGAFFLDLEQVSGAMGRETFYDPRRHFWTKQPFSERGVVRLAEHLWAGLRALTTGPKKVLVLDLDDTLWGGVVGEVGPQGIELSGSPAGEAFIAFQHHVKELRRRGCVLAVCSKNNLEDAREPFERHPEMVLTLDDFAAFEAGWDPKVASLQRISATLGLGLDSFVFFDDSPAERELIRVALPQVEVVDVPRDPAEYVRALEAGLWFESMELTDEDRRRSDQYRTEAKRREEQRSFASLDKYLASLEMTADANPIGDAELQRVEQLIGKTNQFNLTTRRHDAARLRQLLAGPQSIGLAMRLADRFGDYGLTSVVLAVAEAGDGPRTLRIDTWLMSCRIIGRTAEQFLFNALVDRARAAGVSQLIGEFVPTRKNALVRDFYDRLGFEKMAAGKTGSVLYRLDLGHARPAGTFVRPNRGLNHGSNLALNQVPNHGDQ